MMAQSGATFAFWCKNEKGQRIKPLTCCSSGRVDWIRTSDPLTPGMDLMGRIMSAGLS